MSRVVVVTGGTRGIGRAWSSASRGGDRSSRSAATTATSPTRRRWRPFERIGPVDVLVNNAGVSSSAPLARTSLDDWRRQMDVNATGAFLCTRAVLPGMLERGSGRIVTVASTAGRAARATRPPTPPPSTRRSGSCARRRRGGGHRRDGQRGLPGVRAHGHDRRTIASIEAATGQAGEAALADAAPLGPAARARGGGLRRGLPRRRGGRRDQRPDPDPRRWRHPDVKATHFGLEVADGVATSRSTGAERKNPLTFESYAELRDTFRALATATTSTPSCSRARRATSARAATCTTSSGR